ncbi:hypothetical protein O1611_g8433 [Lasiodiplodia mahajangana]|uniref:Uncharacterized protein n=1 Tax=Lasiodiplodia mahajangana TaxID=1108764 RepID=A0ACC2JCU6_9PEZI|nr:hypothetical protein O1611_g8433 [Lasiodiplodia mahajangana]
MAPSKNAFLLTILKQRFFCESNGPNSAEDEVIHLPPIVEAAESSPSAAKQCADMIRDYLKKDYYTRPDIQYNALMLVRILADNPGPTFTRNLDQDFAKTAKDLLRNARGDRVRQMLMETLTSFETTKFYDEGLTPLIEMWKKEKEKAQKASSGQVVTNTPPGEILGNDLIKEFAERCQSASRSIQGYMASENPAPDNETMEALIDTNEQLQNALNLHQRATLNARKHVASLATDNNDLVSLDDRPTNGSDVGLSRRPSLPDTGLGISISSGSGSKQLPAPPRETNGKGKAREYEPLTDPDEPAGSSAAGGSSNRYLEEPRYAFEPFHPGFNNTPSYAGRQESAIDKEAMHGAVEDSSSKKASDAAPASRHADISDSESLYDVSPPKQKEPIYRY